MMLVKAVWMFQRRIKYNIFGDRIMLTKKEIETKYNPERFGVFSQSEIETVSPFLEIRPKITAALQEFHAQKSAITAYESDIEAARAEYDRLIREGLIDEATAAVKVIPSIRKKIDALNRRIPEIRGRVEAFQKSLAFDSDKLVRQVTDAELELEKLRNRVRAIHEDARDTRQSAANVLETITSTGTPIQLIEDGSQSLVVM
jgi:chromosome segregation ATPase